MQGKGASMQLSKDGLRLIKSFEGYHTKRPDGSCEAYLCPAGVPTIGYGCTEGVTLGMVWSETDAEAALHREIEKFERGVTRLTTVDLNQNQFDALVSFSYNCGLGALERSSLLKAVNRQDWSGAAGTFAAWNKGGGRVLPGLVQRRAREASLFLKPAEAPALPTMPQAVTKSLEIGKKAVAAGSAATATIATNLDKIPPPPDLSGWTAWQSAGETIASLGSWAMNRPILTALLAAWIAIAAFSPRFVSRLTSASSS